MKKIAAIAILVVMLLGVIAALAYSIYDGENGEISIGMSILSGLGFFAIICVIAAAICWATGVIAEMQLECEKKGKDK